MGSNLVITKELENYINNNSFNLHKIQEEIINYNNNLGDIKKMQISISQCHFLHLIIKISNIKNILEIGTFTGLSTLSMSLALPADGKITSLDINSDTNKIALGFFKKADQENKIKTIIKPALETIEDLKGKKKKFDMVFIDADKGNYKNYFNLCLDLINQNALIIIDNVLWYGEVVNKHSKDKITKTIMDFNLFVKNDKRIEQLIIPIGDGFTVCRKL